MADLSVTPAQVIPSANVSAQRATAGATIVAGDIVYKDSNGRLQLSDADGATVAQAVTGMAVCGGAAGQPVSYVTEDDDITIGDNCVEGEIYVLSGTAGKMCPAADLAANDKSIFLGAGKAGGKMNFRPVAGGTVQA